MAKIIILCVYSLNKILFSSCPENKANPIILCRFATVNKLKEEQR